MRLYIVRHGKSEGNLRGVHQTPEEKLSEAGLAQARLIAQRFSDITIDKIISSSHKRAEETAIAISEIVKQPVILSNLFTEIKRPSSIIGKGENETAEVRALIRSMWHDPNWRHSDEETFFELRDRGIKGLQYILSLNSDNVLLVSHGILIDILLSLMIYGNNLEPKQFEPILKFFHMENTGLTLFEYNDGHWRIVTWNDQAHLGG
ncbi:MAG TPA: histidine phosphatase family protein [Candidatus Paceibacterota bacterium]